MGLCEPPELHREHEASCFLSEPQERLNAAAAATRTNGVGTASGASAGGACARCHPAPAAPACQGKVLLSGASRAARALSCRQGTGAGSALPRAVGVARGRLSQGAWFKSCPFEQ